MILRATAAAAAVVAVSLALTGCLAPTPEPTPTPTAVFASEDEAFAAAEETYRAYNDADNAWRRDPSAPDPQAYLIGAALEDDIDSRRQFEEWDVRIVGDSHVTSVEGVSADLANGDVQIRTCLDSTETRVLNAIGEDVTLADRDPTVVIDVRLARLGDDLLIKGISPVGDESC